MAEAEASPERVRGISQQTAVHHSEPVAFRMVCASQVEVVARACAVLLAGRDGEQYFLLYFDVAFTA